MRFSTKECLSISHTQIMAPSYVGSKLVDDKGEGDSMFAIGILGIPNLEKKKKDSKLIHSLKGAITSGPTHTKIWV
jgi:hypothetical protein